MLLPNYSMAIVDIAKLTEYCLNEYHHKGKHKARLFKSVLNITSENSDFLKEIIINGIRVYPAVEHETDEYGKRYTVDIKILNIEIITIRTNWIIKTQEVNPRLTSCYAQQK